jgi:hypothetical protein
VDPVARERVVGPERLVDETGNAKLVGAFDGVREGGVVLGTSMDLHPVEDEVASGREGSVIQAADAWVVGEEAQGMGHGSIPCRPVRRAGCGLSQDFVLAPVSVVSLGARGLSRYAMGIDMK